MTRTSITAEGRGDAWGVSVLPGSGHGMMTASEAKIRLAVAVYDEPNHLWLTVDGLVSRGIEVERVGLIVGKSTLDRLSGDLSRHQSGADMFRNWLTACVGMALNSSKCEGMALSPSLLSMWKHGLRIPALWGPRVDEDLTPRLAEDLQQWVERGSAVLTVEPETRKQLWDATRVLLKFSACPVMTLEYSTTPD